MSYTLSLSDSVTTLSLVDGAAYEVLDGGLRLYQHPTTKARGAGSLLQHGSPLVDVRYGNRRIDIHVNILGSSVDNLASNLRAIQDLLEKARVRQVTGYGNNVTLTLQLHGATSGVIFDVVDGVLVLPGRVWSKTRLDLSTRIVDAILELEVKPFGRLASVNLSADTLENHTSGASHSYADIASIQGDMDAPCQIKLIPTGAAGTRKMWIATRSGTRRTDALWFQGEARTAYTTLSTDIALAESTVVDATASGGNISRTTAGPVNLGFNSEVKARWDFTIAAASLPKGQFRVLARVKCDRASLVVAAQMSWAMGYSFGGLSRVPTVGTDDVLIDGTTNYQTLDLGDVLIPPISEASGYTLADFTLRVYAAYRTPNSGVDPLNVATYDLDYVFLLPTDEFVAICTGLASTDRVLVDSLSSQPQLYVLDATDKVTGVADYTGRPPLLSQQDTRLYVLRDDAPAVTFALSGSYRPQLWDLP